MKPNLIPILFAFAAALPLLEQSLRAQEKPAEASFDVPVVLDGLPGAGPLCNEDWFKPLWKDKRSKWATQIAEDQKSVVFLGDSITSRWGQDLVESFPGVKIANRGISGDTTRGMLIRLNEDVLSLNPTVVVLLAGSNDEVSVPLHPRAPLAFVDVFSLLTKR